ncbi:MAG: extracellular solute-binding protein [Clostridia bacterium]|nr:extracellular solute-binding protein [Clostridia bacterium]
MNNYVIKKHTWLFLLAFLFIPSIMPSCAFPFSKSDKTGHVSLNMWHHYLGEQKIVFDKYIEEFNKTVGLEKNIAIKAYSMDNSGDIHNKIIQSANGEPGAPDMPDMATVYPGTAYTLYGMGKVVSVEKYMDTSKTAKYVDSFLEEGRLTSDSGIIIFPIAKSTELLYVNNTVYMKFLQEHNEKNPPNRLDESMLNTFEGILKTAEAYYDWTDAKTPDTANDGTALFGFDAASNFAVVGCRQLSNDFFSTNGRSGTINLGSPAFSKLWDYYHIPMARGYFGAYSYYRSEDVQTGDLVMFAGSTAGAKFFPKTITYKDNTKLDIDLKVLPYPVFENGRKTSVQQGAGVAIMKSTQEKEKASAIFLEWFTDPRRNTEFVLKTGYLPVTKEAIDSILPEELEKLKNYPEYTNVLKVIKQALEMMKTYELYTYKPFENSDEMRFAFEDKFLSAAKASRSDFLKDYEATKNLDTAFKNIARKDKYERFIGEVRNEILKTD